MPHVALETAHFDTQRLIATLVGPWQGGRAPPLIYASLADPQVAESDVFSSEERTRHFLKIENFFPQTTNWNIIIIYLSTFTKKFRFFFQRDYLLLING
jgi:hypothetical protein